MKSREMLIFKIEGVTGLGAKYIRAENKLTAARIVIYAASHDANWGAAQGKKNIRAKNGRVKLSQVLSTPDNARELIESDETAFGGTVVYRAQKMRGKWLSLNALREYENTRM